MKLAGSLEVPVKPRHSHVSYRRQSDVVFRLLVVAAAVFVVLTLAGTALYLILQAWPALIHYGPWSFLASDRWAPSEACAYVCSAADYTRREPR